MIKFESQHVEAEIVDLDHNCRELFPVIDMTKYIGKSVGLTKVEKSSCLYS